jgi:hypothetical protein
MERQTRYRISVALKRFKDSLKPHTGQIVEYNSIAFTVYASGDKYIVLDAVFLDSKQYLDTIRLLEKTKPFVCNSWVPHIVDGVDTYPEYSGIIHGIIHNEFTSFRP